MRDSNCLGLKFLENDKIFGKFSVLLERKNKL